MRFRKKKYPDMTLVSNKNETTEDSEVAYQKTQELLRTYPNVKGFLGSAMADVPGLPERLKSRDWKTAPLLSEHVLYLPQNSIWNPELLIKLHSGTLRMQVMHWQNFVSKF